MRVVNIHSHIDFGANRDDFGTSWVVNIANHIDFGVVQVVNIVNQVDFRAKQDDFGTEQVDFEANRMANFKNRMDFGTDHITNMKKRSDFIPLQAAHSAEQNSISENHHPKMSTIVSNSEKQECIGSCTVDMIQG